MLRLCFGLHCHIRLRIVQQLEIIKLALVFRPWRFLPTDRRHFIFRWIDQYDAESCLSLASFAVASFCYLQAVFVPASMRIFLFSFRASNALIFLSSLCVVSAVPWHYRHFPHRLVDAFFTSGAGGVQAVSVATIFFNTFTNAQSLKSNLLFNFWRIKIRSLDACTRDIHGCFIGLVWV